MGVEDVRSQLAHTVRSIQWSYAIFWSISPSKPGVLEWGNGYYNGDIKTMKTVHSTELNSDPQGLQRSEQLRELFQHLSASESPQTKRPSASLSPEDLCDTEWYYLVCMSFLFNIGQGLPGKTLAKGQPIWLTNANFADTKGFTRSLLAKSASIQTVVCFPFLGGVIELGVTEVVKEDQNLINFVKASLLNDLKLGNMINGVEYFNSNLGFETKDEISCKTSSTHMETEESFMIEERISEEQTIQIMDDDFSYNKQGSVASSDCMSETLASPSIVDVGDMHYQNVVSSLSKASHNLIFRHPRKSSFGSWKWRSSKYLRRESESKSKTPQKLMKMILMDVPLMHKHGLSERSENKTEAEASSPEIINEQLAILRTTLPSSIRHKDDKESILDDTIDYLHQLERRIEELESCVRLGDMKTNTNETTNDSVEGASDNYKGYIFRNRNKRKVTDIVETKNDVSSCSVSVVSCGGNVEIEMECWWKEGLLLDIIDILSCLRLDSQTVQSNAADGILFVAIKAKARHLGVVVSSEAIKEALQRVASNG